MSETFEQKCERNARVQLRYDELMREGKRGHYETMFRVVREEVERAIRMEQNRGDLLEENIWCLHKCLDDAGVPRSDGDGKTFSMWGRVVRYAAAQRSTQEDPTK